MIPDDIKQIVEEHVIKSQQHWNYPDNISDVNRRIAVGWMWDVYCDGLQHVDPRAICLAITLFDHHISLESVNFEIIQLVVLAALWIGSKVYWATPFSIHELQNLCDYTYDNKTIVAMEIQLLQENNYNVTGSLLPDFCTVSVDLMRVVTSAVNLGEYSLDELGTTLTEIETDQDHNPTYPVCFDDVIDEIPMYILWFTQ
jgi:hypothetical protein